MASFWLDPATNKRYNENRAFSYGDINYTCQGANASTFTELGFTPVVVGRRPSDKFYFVSGPNDDGSYNATPRDLAQLKEGLIGEARTAVSQLLTPTDWYYARQVELGDPGRVPAEVSAYRQAVRGAYEARKEAINACADVSELEVLEAPVWPTMATTGTTATCDYRGFYTALLVSNVFQTMRSQAATNLAVNMNYTDFIAALADAKMGLVLVPAFQSCIDLLIPSLNLPTEEIEELAQLYAMFGLDELYTVPGWE
mgnify:CR=1 FL=1